MKLTPGLLRFLCPTIKILEPELSLIRVPKREHQKVQKNGVPKMCIFIIFILIATLVTFVCKGRQVGSLERYQFLDCRVCNSNPGGEENFLKNYSSTILLMQARD